MAHKKKTTSSKSGSVKPSSEQQTTETTPDLFIEKGPVRPYIVTEPPKELTASRTITTMKEKLMLLALIVFTASIRLPRLSQPNSVVFDEVHFGKFASYYIKGEFFMDVHPPLAKMLYAGVAALAGFKGDFLFPEIGALYPKDVPYVVMRTFSAALGSCTVILLYLTLRASGVRSWIAFVCGLCFAIENSYVTISRYILLDSPLIFFIAASAYAFKKYETYHSFSIGSLKTLIATGLCLGMAASSKWVGLFTIAWIGLLCIWRLWFMVGDLSKSVKSVFMIAIMKLVCLLGIPTILYLLFFQVHFQSLRFEGDGSSFLSSEFRSALIGNTIPQNMVYDVGVGSMVTLRHTGTMGGYLHSHQHNYPVGSEQQQITLYPHLDFNNEWIIESNNAPGVTFKSFHNLSDGTVIKLLHPGTQCRLHSHDHKAPVSENSDWQKEVSCYGYPGFTGDGNDDWIIEIDKSKSVPGEAQERIIAINTKFRLKHALSGCYLFSHETKLPEWGFQQQEVTCAHSGKAYLTLWYIEGSENPLLPEDTKRISYKAPSFLQKFIESHQKMWHINSNLVEPHYFESLPTSWPLLSRGISYWGDDTHHKTVYLLGNAIVWWSVSAFIVVFAIVVLYELISWQVGKSILQDSNVVNFHVQVIHYLLGFAIHFAPSFLMKRQMFLHHYLPAYYFGVLALGHALDITCTHVLKRKKTFAYIFLGVFFCASYYFFNNHTAIIYGDEWTKEACKSSRWVSTWDYNCDIFLDKYEDYATLELETEETPLRTMPYPTLSSESSPVIEINKNVVELEAEKVERQKPSDAPPVPGKETYDDIMKQPGAKIFKDQYGNSIDPDVAKQWLQQEGGSILRVEKKTVKTKLPKN
ncbi:uncharacterized protein NDAI_0B03170 [Naumovozyma dairenensis CBS 421]|uniref:Dolichyl-phosphate-mannose--protein mannosyltransferase n=1 Tax=Naumovozyma dairenensis (strain ATCC 10597 / BCRC 20456 / CBS 421 / NBRC 0211 / NRRL Y-12639) TaxID=1071378 RepID=G0W6E1_NAUDC|nr:hypothetical protein NDAI_0B03170 [Naumovozyma dairenensis CBS 421]CCD23352.1 hypothetical protein NDAI_0B03170 [Naumovozyma dairenensis CBS 421]